jgi:hypothetical protein
MASSEQNKAAVREFFACASSGELDRLEVFVSPDYVLHDPSLPEEVRGVDGVRELVETYRGGIAGLAVTIDHQRGWATTSPRATPAAASTRATSWVCRQPAGT